MTKKFKMNNNNSYSNKQIGNKNVICDKKTPRLG